MFTHQLTREHERDLRAAAALAHLQRSARRGTRRRARLLAGVSRVRTTRG